MQLAISCLNRFLNNFFSGLFLLQDMEADEVESDCDGPERLLDAWLGELDTLTGVSLVTRDPMLQLSFRLARFLANGTSACLFPGHQQATRCS